MVEYMPLKATNWQAFEFQDLYISKNGNKSETREVTK